MEEKVVTVEKCHGCTNGLRIKKTNHKMHTSDPDPPVAPPPWDRGSLCIPMGLHVSLAHKHAL